jgi:predicted RNA-binding Zn-ribbon protein involved in translation (DUF1610 family)
MKEKHDRNWGRWDALINLIYVVPIFVAVILAIKQVTRIEYAILVVALSVTAGILIDRKRFHGYKCPDCRETLPPPERWWAVRAKPTKVRFVCNKCDVVWTTSHSYATDIGD